MNFLSIKSIVFLFIIFFSFLFIQTCIFLCKFEYYDMDFIFPKKEIYLEKYKGRRLLFGGEYTAYILIRIPNIESYMKIVKNIEKNDPDFSIKREKGMFIKNEIYWKKIFQFVPNSIRDKFGNDSIIFNNISFERSGKMNYFDIIFSEDKKYAYIMYRRFSK